MTLCKIPSNELEIMAANFAYEAGYEDFPEYMECNTKQELIEMIEFSGELMDTNPQILNSVATEILHLFKIKA